MILHYKEYHKHVTSSTGKSISIRTVLFLSFPPLLKYVHVLLIGVLGLDWPNGWIYQIMKQTFRIKSSSSNHLHESEKKISTRIIKFRKITISKQKKYFGTWFYKRLLYLYARCFKDDVLLVGQRPLYYYYLVFFIFFFSNQAQAPP